MGIGTHLGPWLLGTVKDTTGATSGTARNLGATVVAQTKNIAFGDAANSVAFCLPAGSLIVNIQIATTATYNAATSIVLSGNGTAITSSTTITSIGYFTPTTVASSGAAAYITNTGTAPTFVTYTITGTSLNSGASTIYIQYIVRNPDGTV